MQTNIERFNLCTGYIIGQLYDQFPVARELRPEQIVKAMGGTLAFPDGTTDGDKNGFVGNTLLWLQETGYLVARGEAPKRWVLAPKALEMTNALPDALKIKNPAEPEKSVGQQLLEFSKETGKEAVSEVKKKGIQELVMRGIGLLATHNILS